LRSKCAFCEKGPEVEKIGKPADGSVLSNEGGGWLVYQKSIPLLFVSVCFLWSIFGLTDTDIAVIFRGILGRSTEIIPPNRQFLFESVLPNYFGAALTALIEDNKAITIGWLLIGAGLFVYVLFLLLFRKFIDWKTIFLVAFFSPILKICVSWVGKSDLYLLAFLLFPIFSQSNSAIIFLSSALAALCHPQIAIISLVLLECARFMLRQRPRLSTVGGAVVGLIVAKIDLHIFALEGASGRFDYITKFMPDLVLSGAFDAVSFSIMSIVPSLLLFLASGVMKPPGFRELWKVNVIPFVVCLSAITVICIFLTLDRSRVFTLLTFPAYAVLLHAYREELVTFFLARTLMCSLIALLMLAAPQLGARDWIVSTYVERHFINAIGSDALRNHMQCRTSCNDKLFK
jgi:hypothetical protein